MPRKTLTTDEADEDDGTPEGSKDKPDILLDVASLRTDDVQERVGSTQLHSTACVDKLNPDLRRDTPKQNGLPRNEIIISGCSDVTIGPSINTPRFTIDQSVDHHDLNNSRTKLTVTGGGKDRWSYLPIILGTVLIAAVITVAVVVSLILLDKPVSDVAEDLLPANYTLRLVKKSEWTRYPKAELRPLTVQPARYVVVCHTVYSFCRTPATCTNIVRSIESAHVEKGLSTAWYNFMIGGDGLIYEARGWDHEGDHSPGFNCASIGVAFLGNFDRDKLEEPMISAYHLLVDEGVRRGFLEKDYKMVAHYQVKATASPGLDVKMHLKTWPHRAFLGPEDFTCA